MLKLLLVFISLTLGAQAANDPPVQTAPAVDLNKYLGIWYEIATIPMFFQRKCVKNVQADYSLTKEGLIKVVNSCETAEGIKSADGRARVADSASQSKLQVTFVKVFNWVFALGGNYWILDVDQDYSYAVVGDPSRKYGWILSRQRNLSSELLARAELTLKNNGYELCQFMITIQDGGASAKKSLCD